VGVSEAGGGGVGAFTVRGAEDSLIVGVRVAGIEALGEIVSNGVVSNRRHPAAAKIRNITMMSFEYPLTSTSDACSTFGSISRTVRQKLNERQFNRLQKYFDDFRIEYRSSILPIVADFKLNIQIVASFGKGRCWQKRDRFLNLATCNFTCI
jgi:hypothetical protein